jgi:hypothetical protein
MKAPVVVFEGIRAPVPVRTGPKQTFTPTFQNNGLAYNTNTVPVVSPTPNAQNAGPKIELKKAQVLRQCHFDDKAGIPANVLVHDLVARVKKQPSMLFELDLAKMQAEINAITIPRMISALGDLIFSYHELNPSDVTVMGKGSAIPYMGLYRPVSETNKTEYVDFDLQNMPDSLLIMISEYIKMVKTYAEEGGK